MISIVATVRAPEADLRLWTAYHRNLGVDRLHLFFDDPADPALSAIAALPGVVATACTPAHWAAGGLTHADGIEARQVHNATLALARCREAGTGWLLHIDIDELIAVPGFDLVSWFSRRGPATDTVVFPVMEAFPARAPRRHVFRDCGLFKVSPKASRLELARRFGCHQSLRYGYFCGHTLGKSAARLEGHVDIVGIHHCGRADGAPLRIETADTAAVLHYDGCGFEDWRVKWERRKDADNLPTHMRPSRRQQFEDFLAADAKGDPEALLREFRRQRMTPAYERAVLFALGLARRVHLPAKLFTPPA